MLFKTSLDKTAVVITVIFTLLFACITLLPYVTVSAGNAISPWYTTVLVLLLYGFAFVYRPAAYKITGDAVVICRPISNVQIKRTAIESIAVVDKKEISGCVRTFGVGGLFGYYGCFANYKLGSMVWYATRKDKAVLITTLDIKKILITPNNPEAFIAAFHA